jgi:penicillin-binding protein 2
MYNQGYKTGDVIGKTGIEKQYDSILRGTEGWETRTVDARGRRVANLNDSASRKAPVMGKNLVLTIDRNIQTLAEKALGARMGAVVVLRPTTGEVLAMVSYPWYDPNLFKRSSSSREYTALLNDPEKPLLNRAIQSSYPPGSTFKIIMTTGIYDTHCIDPEQTIDCPGEINYGGRIWKCWIHKPGHGPQNLHQALANSCDIYFWTVGRDYLGQANIVNYAQDYGLGSLSGIDLPGEIAGVIPTPQWKERRFHEQWLAGDTMNMSIGQGYTLVTPIQMADIAAMVVNDGVIYKPHVLMEVRDPVSGAITQEIKPEVLHKSEVSRQVFENLKKDMRGVIAHGTAVYPLNIKAVKIAGKTGTAEVGLVDHWHSWFTSFAPYGAKPEDQIVVACIVEATNTWEWWAVYASAIIYQGIFAHQTYEQAIRTLGFANRKPIQGRRE